MKYLALLSGIVAAHQPYNLECLAFPTIRPTNFTDEPEEVKFDPNIHFAFEEPKTIKDINFNELEYPVKDNKDFETAYSAPTNVFSEEGLKVIKSIVQKHEHKALQNVRNNSVRGLTYWSKFFRDFVYDKSFLSYVSKMANKTLCPHSFGMHTSQVNLGKVENFGRDVDVWHFDSVDYVLVIILSDITGMVGGELEVLEMNLGGPEGTKLLKEQGGPPRDKVKTMSYEKAGAGIFAQGSKIMHRVTPVQSAKEARTSLVISFMTTDAFGKDNTRTTRQTKDPGAIQDWEFAKHTSWRVKGQLDYIINQSDPNTWAPKDFAAKLNEAAEKLKRAAAIINGEIDDGVGHINTNKNTNQTQDL